MSYFSIVSLPHLNQALISSEFSHLSWRCRRPFRSFAWLPVLDVFFSLSGLSESVYKDTLPYFFFFFLFPSLMLDFLVDSYIVVWILVRLLLSEPRDIKSSITSYLFSSVLGRCLIYLIIYISEADTPDWNELNRLTGQLPLLNDLTYWANCSDWTNLSGWLSDMKNLQTTILILIWSEPTKPNQRPIKNDGPTKWYSCPW